MEKNKSRVYVFGIDAPVVTGGWGCGSGGACGEPAKTMKDEAGELAVKLKDVFGDRVECAFINVKTNEIKNYPEVEKILDRVRLPLTVINDQPRFHGGLNQEMIIDAVKEQLDKTEQ